MPIWDSRRHTKNKFYRSEELDQKETVKLFKELGVSDKNIQFKKISELSQDPNLIAKSLNPSKVVMGKLQSSISLT